MGARWHRCLKKNGPQAIGKSRDGGRTKVHMVAACSMRHIAFIYFALIVEALRQ
jgi:hypothetical protein